MAADPPPPPPPPDEPEDEVAAKEEELFALFRHLRERVFAGSSEIVSHVMRGIEAQIPTAPRESFAATVLVQLTNWITSWVDPEARDGDDADRTKDPNAEARPEAPAGDDGLSSGDDDE